MSDQLEQIATYLGLIVQNAGGEIRVPFSEAEKGLPANSGVRVIIDPENEEVVFVIQELPDAE